MNIKEYIESGILEAYVLGALPEQERAHVAADIAMYPELKLELEAIEDAMQQFAVANAIKPPAFMQEQIWNSLKGDEEDVVATPPVAQPAPKVVEFIPERKGNNQWLRAAAIAALLGSLAMNVVFWSQLNKGKEAVTAMQQSMDNVTAEQQKVTAQLEAYKGERTMLVAAGMKPIAMQSVKPEAKVAGMVFWSKDKGDTYLSMLDMPMPPEGKQYQFWVIQDGKPVDMGVIPNDMVAKGGMLKMPQQIMAGQAFAISLENAGGNPTPTDVLVVGAI